MFVILKGLWLLVVVIVMNQALYVKATEIVWIQKYIFSNDGHFMLLVMLGQF